MSNIQISFIYKKYRNPDDVRDTNSFSAIHATINSDAEEERYTSRTIPYQDFIEDILDKVFEGDQSNKSVEITETGFKIDEAFKQYLSDKYPKISFK